MTQPKPSRSWTVVFSFLAVVFVGGLLFLALAGSGRGLGYLLVPLSGVSLLAMLLARRFVIRRWTWAAGLGLMVAFMLAFLAGDEPLVHRRATLEEVSPSFPGADLSHEVLLRLSSPEMKNLGGGNRRVFQGMGPGMSIDASEPDKFRNFLMAQRTAILADWEDLAIVREWWSELAGFDRIGDMSSGQPSDPLPAFQPIRAYSQTASAIAGLQALDGDGDAAFATLQPLLEVSRKLEPSSRTLVRSMIALVAQRQAIHTATFVLDTTSVSPQAKARFAEALAIGNGGPEGARHLIAAETARTAFMLDDPYRFGHENTGQGDAWALALANAAGSVVYNRQRTLNTYLEWNTQVQEAAARRDFATMDAVTKKLIEEDAALGLRNFAGNLLIQQATPALSKVVESYWSTEDKRMALIKRLRESEPAASAK